MKESSKERLATLLMDELLEQLSARESLLKMLGEMTSLPIDEVIEHLLADFEHTVEEYFQNHPPISKHVTGKRPEQVEHESTAIAEHEVQSPRVSPSTPVERVAAAQSKTEPSIAEPAKREPVKPEPARPEPAKPEPARQDPTVSSPAQRMVSKQTERESSAPVSVKLDPIKLEFPKIKLKILDNKVVSPPREEIHQVRAVPEVREEQMPSPEIMKRDEELRELEILAKKIESEYTARAELFKSKPPSPKEEWKDERVQAIGPENHSVIDTTGIDEEEDDEIITGDTGGSGKQATRARHDFADDEYVYVHAVSRIPADEAPMPEPFMLEEKGIDGHEFAFALDYSGMRFYLSRINPNELNVSKAMVLLLNKQESIQLQGIHESTLNDLRGHGILLPLEFGTVARGKDSLLGIIDKNLDDLEEALDDVEKTTWWTVTASVLDATIGQLVGTDVHAVGRDRSRNRASYTSSPQGKKFDIKVLERILQREKKLAESVHAELSTVAGRSDVETMVGLGSGSSEDWKAILRASYDVPRRDIEKFNRTVTDLQYHHLQYDLMLALTGKRDCITLRRK
jgi:hypothetical protein